MTPLAGRRLKHAVFADAGPRVAYLHPAASFMLRFLDDEAELRESFEGARLAEAELVLAPVNDNADAGAAGGSHWGLLAYSRPDDTFRYLDSHVPGNLPVARELAPKLALLVGGGARSARALRAEDGCPQQRNGHDCGVFALAFAEHLAARALGRERAPLAEAVTQASVERLREAMREDALALAAAAAQQREA